MRTQVFLIETLLIETAYGAYWCYNLSDNEDSIYLDSGNPKTSLNFFIWSSLIPLALHIMLLAAICFFWGTHFHKNGFRHLFFC